MLVVEKNTDILLSKDVSSFKNSLPVLIVIVKGMIKVSAGYLIDFR